MNKISEESQIVRAILNNLIVLKSHLILYGRDNENIAQTTSRLFAFLEHLFAVRDNLVLLVARHGFLFEQEFVDRKNVNFEKFAYQMFQHGIAALRIEQGVSFDSLQTFLQLVSRKPSETWDNGGFEACLGARNVTRLEVRELTDSDFLLREATSDDSDDILWGGTSRIWDAFAQSLLQDMDETDNQDDTASAPQSLAERANRSFSNGDPARKLNFARDASRFLLTLKHENIIPYRNTAMRRLIAFVEQLSPALRKMFLNNTFNLNVPPELAEQFFSGLPDEVILDALGDITDNDTYVPPVILKLLGKLAKNRGMEARLPRTDSGGDLRNDSDRIKTLFKPDDFKKFVPEDYQQTLLEILESHSLPIASSERMARLKQTLEQDMLDDHMGAVLFEIFRKEPDARHAAGIARHLIETCDHYLEAGQFRKITLLCRKCLATEENAKRFPDVVNYLTSDRFTTAVLDAARPMVETTGEEILELVAFIRKPFIEPLLNRLPQEEDRTLRSLYFDCLRRIGNAVISSAVARLADDRWFVQRDMLYLLRELGDEPSLPAVRSLLDHSHPQVALEALKTCLAFGGQDAEEHLLRRLDTAKGTEQLKVIMLAGMIESDRIVDRLLDFLGPTALFDYRLDLRKTAVRSLAIRAPSRALPVLASILESRSLLHSREHNAIKVEILEALGKFPAADVLPLLDAQTKSKVPEIARQAAAVQLRLSRRQA